MKRLLQIFIGLFFTIYSLMCFGQRAVTIGLQGGSNWGYYNAYLINNRNIWVSKNKILPTPKIVAFIDVQAIGNFHMQLGADITTLKTKIEGASMGTIIATYTNGQFEKIEDVKYNYDATEVLQLQYLRFPLYATYHLQFNPRFKLIYGLGAAYGHLLKMENKVVAGPQLISNRRFSDHDFVLSAFHAAELTFCKQWGVRLSIYYDHGIVDIDGGTMNDIVKNSEIPKVYSGYFGASIGITYNLSKPKAE